MNENLFCKKAAPSICGAMPFCVARSVLTAHDAQIIWRE
jgi:hypothetical protein